MKIMESVIRSCVETFGSAGRIRILTAVLWLCVWFPQGLHAQIRDRLFDLDPNAPWHIVADEITYEQAKDLYMARGAVTITKQDRTLSADFVLFDHLAMTAQAEGHVIMTVGDDVLAGDRMELDLEAETGTIYDGTIFIKKRNFYIRGNRIDKTGKGSFAADLASVSSCDGDKPAWKITGRNLRVTLEGYGTVRHAALWVKEIPVLYSPVLAFPVKQNRQSGLLRPQWGGSDRKGAEYNQPFYWAIDESSDATFYDHYMSRRGNKIGLEYRYLLTERSQGASMLDFFRDDKIDDGLPGSEDFGFTGDASLRTNRDRYWFRMKHDQELPGDFKAKLDLDVVSDQDYLLEFQNGYNGFLDTEAYFLGAFGRELDDYNDPVRVNRLNVNRIGPGHALNAELRWYDDLIARQNGNAGQTLQKLPFVTFSAFKRPIPGSPFYFDLESEYDHFFREEGDTGLRADAHPRAYWPLRIRHYAVVEPSVGYRQTFWQADGNENGAERDGFLHRELFDFNLDMSSEMYRVFQADTGSVDRVKHSLRPRIRYEYIPDYNQGDFPSFEPADRVAEKNRVAYSLTNTWTLRYHRADSDPASSTYHQLCRFKLEQSYDLEESDETLTDAIGQETAGRPFSPVRAELFYTPRDFIGLQADAEWSADQARFISRNVAANLWDRRGDRLFVEHRFSRELIESIYASLIVKVSGTVTTYADYERNLREDDTLKSGLGLLFSGQCWALDLRYSDEENDRRYQLTVNLYGLGQIGKAFAGGTLESSF